MILYIFSFVIFIFVSFSLFFRTQMPVWIKLAGTLIIFIISMKYVIYQVIGKAFFSPDLPSALIIIMEALYGALIVLFVFLLLLDCYQLVNWLMARAGIPTPRNFPKKWICAALVLAALGLGAYGTWETIRVPDVHEIRLELANLPCNLNGLKLVQLTDLHIGPILKSEWLLKVVEKVNALDPDFVLMTGDYIDGYADKISHELEPLADLKAKYGVFAVSGNHEYYWNVTQWEEVIKKMGVTWLDNEHRAVEIGQEKIVVAGIPDYNAVRFGFPGPDLEQALKNAPSGVRFLLSHQPRNGKSNLEEVDLQLSGHTHGGIMFFVSPIIAAFNEGFVKGAYASQAGKAVYVSPGTGLWNGFSCRIGVPAEITLITLACMEDKKEKTE